MSYMFIGFLAAVFFSSLVSASEILRSDPYLQELPQKADYLLPIRIINHGIPEYEQWTREQIRAAELIFSQCGVRLKIQCVDREELPKSNEQDRLTYYQNDKAYFTPGALNIFEAVFAGKDPSVMDIHIVDHLNAEIRSSGSTINQEMSLGISFNPPLFGWIYHGTPVELAGQHLFVAAETVMYDKRNFIRLQGMRAYPRHLSLLAHEIGHQILESQRTPAPEYHDHWCTGQQDYCPSGNLMVGGGNEDRIWKHESRNKVLGFDPLPKLDSRQCRQLIEHPLIQAL